MEQQREYTVSDAIVDALVQAQVDTVYGIVSIHNMPIYDAIYRNGSIRIVTARGESGAVNMADAHARATGKLGVVITSTGAGAGNGAGSLTEAWNAGIPLLHITGEADADYIGTDQRYIHECKDQLQMMEGANKHAYTLKRPKQIAPFMLRAIKDALTVPTGPVTVQIPTNYQAQIVPNHQFLELGASEEREPSMNLPTHMIEKIAVAKRPILWVGSGAIKSGASGELLSLMEKIQPAVITSEAAKGVVPENHPLCIGNFAATPQVAGLLEQADLLLSIGVRFRGGETFDWTIPIPENHINIDADPNAFNRNFETPYGLIGDAKFILQAINQALENKKVNPDPNYVGEVKGVRQAVRDELRQAIEPYGDIADIISEHLPEDTILVTDVTIPGYTWGNKLIDIHEPRNYLFMAGGGIGQGLPMAIGAKIGQPKKPVVLIAGDGGFMVNAGEMITAIQENTPIIVLLFDDGGYGILRYYQEAAYGRRTSVDLKNPDFVMMAQSMGFASEKVTSVEEFEKGLARAVASGKPYLVVVDVESVGTLHYQDSDEYIASFHPQDKPR
jgi:acetolactate synthase-1/2/3 large subunit